MVFRQQLTLTSAANGGTTGTGVKYGFGNDPKTRFSLQATFEDANGALQNPTSAEVTIKPTNDSQAYNSSAILDWNYGSSQQNGDILSIANVGPFSGIMVDWNITWGATATKCFVTFQAIKEGWS